MEKSDAFLVTSFLSPEDIVFEWGSGMSTWFFSNFVSEYIAVEHNLGWYSNISMLLKTDQANSVVDHITYLLDSILVYAYNVDMYLLHPLLQMRAAKLGRLLPDIPTTKTISKPWKVIRSTK